MPELEIAGECGTAITTENKFEIEAGCGVSFDVTTPFQVDASLKRWTICNDNIYLLKFYEAPPAWLNDMITNIVSDMGLVEDLDDLEDRFTNFEEGYTAHFYDWKVGDAETLAYVETIYTSNAVFNAGIQDIKVAYVSKNESGAYFDSLIGAWQTGQGGAWFNDQVAVVSNVAYSAAKSTSVLTATVKSQQDNIAAIVGDISTIEKQIDGKVVTWFVASTDQGDGEPWDPIGPAHPDGSLNVDARPYWCWLPGNICPEDIYENDTDKDTRPEHTGDTYVYYEYDTNGNKNIISTWRFGKDPYTDEYGWFIFTDDIATQAYQQALDSYALADSKINSFYQTYPPTLIANPTLGEGDIWVDSDAQNRMYRYDGTNWVIVRDTDITASVTRLDEATVDIAGKARAKSSLVVNAQGVVSGYVAESDNSTWSSFKIFADKFSIANTAGQPANTVPFRVDTTTNDIWFNGYVNFSNILDNGLTPDWVFNSTLTDAIDRNVTTINGGKITTGYVDARYLGVDTVWTRGMIISTDYNGSRTGYIGNSSPKGFMLNATAGAGSYNEPNIYGSYIRGGEMYATHLEAVRIDAAKIHGGYIYGATIETGNLIAPSINGMKFKMGSFVTKIDGSEPVYFSDTEGYGYTQSFAKYKVGTTTDVTGRFTKCMGVSLSMNWAPSGAHDIPYHLPVLFDDGFSGFWFNRHNSLNGWVVISYIAWGY